MAVINNTIIADILKVRYPEPVVQDLTYRQQAILPYLKKWRKSAGGKNQSFSIETYRSSSSRYAAEGAALVAATANEYKRGYVDMCTVYTRQYLSQEAISDTKAGGEAALFSAIGQVPKNCARDHAFHLARSAWGLDVGGALAVCGTTAGSTTMQLATTANMRKFHRGMIVDVLNATTGADVHADCTISAVDEAACTITTGTSATTTSSYSVYVQDEGYGASSVLVGRGAYPIPVLVGTGNACNITVSSYPEWKSYVNTATGSLSLAKVQAGVDWVEARSEKKLATIFASPEVIIKYSDILLGDVRYKPEDLGNWQAGYPTTLFYVGGTMGKMPIIKDHLMPKDELYIIGDGAFSNYTTDWLTWFAPEAQFSRVAGYLQWEMTLFSRHNLALPARQASAKLQAIAI